MNTLKLWKKQPFSIDRSNLAGHHFPDSSSRLLIVGNHYPSDWVLMCADRMVGSAHYTCHLATFCSDNKSWQLELLLESIFVLSHLLSCSPTISANRNGALNSIRVALSRTQLMPSLRAGAVLLTHKRVAHSETLGDDQVTLSTTESIKKRGDTVCQSDSEQTSNEQWQLNLH